MFRRRIYIKLIVNSVCFCVGDRIIVVFSERERERERERESFRALEEKSCVVVFSFRLHVNYLID